MTGPIRQVDSPHSMEANPCGLLYTGLTSTSWITIQYMSLEFYEDTVSQTSSIRVLLIDDHDVNSPGLIPFFRAYEEFDFIGRAGSEQEAGRLYRQHGPQVVLLDLRRPELDCVRLVKYIKALGSETQIIALTNYTSQTLSNNALQAGAAAVVTKGLSIEALAAAIRLAAETPLQDATTGTCTGL